MGTNLSFITLKTPLIREITLKKTFHDLEATFTVINYHVQNLGFKTKILLKC